MIRALPAAILLMALLVVLKVAGLLTGMIHVAPGLLPAAQAATAHGAASSPHAAPAPPKPEAEDKAADAAPPPPADPPVSDAERALLQDLRARRTALDARAQAVAAREAVLAAAEARLSDRVAQLTAMQQKLEALEGARKDREEANWRSMVKTYEAMRPRDAATIFNDLDQPVLMELLGRMKEAKAAAVLGAMLPERARAATAQLAHWRADTTRTGG